MGPHSRKFETRNVARTVIRRVGVKRAAVSPKRKGKRSNKLDNLKHGGRLHPRPPEAR